MMGPGDPNDPNAVPGPPQGVHGAAPSDLIEFLEAVTRSGPIDTITVWQESLEGRQKLRVIGVKAIDPIEMSANLSRLIQGWTLARNARTVFILDAHAGAEHRGSHPIVRMPQPTLTSQPTEQPTEAGVLSMTMRHQEATMRTAHVMIDANAGHLTRLLKRAEERIVILENREVDNMVRLRDNILQSVDIEYLREQNRLKVHVQAQAFGVLIQALPSIIQKFTANEVVEKFRVFAATLKPEQQLGIGAVLNKDQTELLAQLFQSLEKPKLPGAVEKALTEGDPAVSTATAPPAAE